MNLNDNNKLHLSYLIEQDDVVLTDFCKLAWDYIVKGVNPKLYSTASDKLGITSQDLQHVIEALVHLMVEACKNKLTSTKFKECLLALKFTEKQIFVLSEFYKAKQIDINNTLLAGSVCIPMFKSLEWRLQATIGSRALPQQLEPSTLLKLSLENSEPGSILLTAGPCELVSVTETLEAALREATAQHARRVSRRFCPSAP